VAVRTLTRHLRTWDAWQVELTPPNGQPAATVSPQPTPFSFSTGSARIADGQRLIVVQVGMVTGTVVLFMSPEDAERMARQWLAEAQKTPGLIIPSPVLPPLG
jgi:hypothetical protein